MTTAAQQPFAGIAEPVQADRIRRLAEQPLRGGAAPMPAGGLFDETATKQTDLLDWLTAPTPDRRENRQ